METFRFEALPDDVFDTLTDLLTGWDLVPLSHTTRYLYERLADEALWEARLKDAHCVRRTPSASMKQRYMQGHSCVFTGQKIDRPQRVSRGGCVNVASTTRQREPVISVDCWFCLLPPSLDEGVFVGGIIFGGQSNSFTNRAWPHYHQQFIHVDRERNLYCSLLDGKEVVATNLVFERWYHVAVTYANMQQAVYVNGSLFSRRQGYIHREWMMLRNLQVGSGCISGGAMGEPTQDFNDWYGFHGAIDEFRMWSTELSEAEVASLAHGGDVVPTPEFVMAHGVKHGNVTRVRCTRRGDGVFALEKKCGSGLG